jgi:hypothetical protein
MNHQYFLNLIKTTVGCSFVGYEQYKESYNLKIIKNKGEKAIYVPLTGTPEDVTPQSYAKVIQDLQKRYEQI